MAEPAAGRSDLRGRLPLLMAGLAAIGLGLSLLSLQRTAPAGHWLTALAAPDPNRLGDLLVHYSLAPRIATALLVGAALSAAAVLFQQALRNRVVEPATLGVSAGAFLALGMATSYAPALLSWGRAGVALVGALGAALAVMTMARRGRFTPQAILVSGLMVTLYAGSLNTLLIMLNGGLITLFVWGSGSLAMQDWAPVRNLVPQLTVASLCIVPIVRPLAALGISDETAKGLGAAPNTTRLVAVLLGLWMTAVCVSAVGVIGFVGLAAPELVRRSGFEKTRDQLLRAPIVGALLLWVSDQTFQVLPTPSTIPVGAGTAFLGAPLLVWFALRARSGPSEILILYGAASRPRRPAGGLALVVLMTVLFAVLALFSGRSLHGWQFSGLSSLDATLYWRLPRMTASAGAGVLVAISGVIVQRLTDNPLASPESLGISSGASCGAIAILLLWPGASGGLTVAATALGGAGVFALLLAVGIRHGFAPDRLLVTGIAIASFFSAIVSVLLATGDPRLFELLAWLNGSTSFVQTGQAAAIGFAAVAAVAGTPLLARWLDILPLGAETALATGLSLRASRLTLLCVAVVLTAVSVLTIGPLTFVGLLAPLLAHRLGFTRAVPQTWAAAAFAALIMIVADWLGRNLAFPNQVPAGLVATIIGVPYLALGAERQRSSYTKGL